MDGFYSSSKEFNEKSVARYYLDMQDAVKRSSLMLNNDGMIFFVIVDIIFFPNLF